MSERPMLPVRRIRPRPMLPVLTGCRDANNAPRDVSVSLTNAEYEALRYLVDYCASEPYFGHGRRDVQALADARMALDALSDGLGLS